MTQDTTTPPEAANEDIGAIPGLDGKPTTQVLGVPGGETKNKSNVNRLVVLGMLVAFMLFAVGGLLIYQKNKKKRQEAPENVKLIKPGFLSENAALESEAIERKKKELKANQAEQEAQAVLVEAQAKAEALEQERLASLSTPNTPAAGRKPAQAGVAAPGATQGAGQAPATATATGQAPANGAPVAPRPMTVQERKMSGGAMVDPYGSRSAPATASGGGGGSSAEQQRQADIQRRLAAANVSLPPGGGGASPFGAAGFGGAPGGPGAGAGGGEGLAAKLQPSVLAGRTASKLPNLDYLLKRGTFIPCALKTGIDTTLPGFVICVVLQDVYSANGKVVLVERGATVFGEQQSSLKQGQARTFVVWGRIDNPSGVFANIDSPATDQMGYSGIPGHVETYFWQRFGGAIMLSLIKDFSAAAAARSAGGNGVQTTSNTNQATQDMAAEALRNSINIPPTLQVLPGTIVNVLVARDVSFQDVYTVAQ